MRWRQPGTCVEAILEKKLSRAVIFMNSSIEYFEQIMLLSREYVKRMSSTEYLLSRSTKFNEDSNLSSLSSLRKEKDLHFVSNESGSTLGMKLDIC